jgi:hypothetical protein
MKNKKLQEFLKVGWERVLSNEEDVIELFKVLNVRHLNNIHIIARTHLHDNRLTVLIGASDAKGRPFSVIIDATSSIPTWGQFVNVTYDQCQ